MIPSPEMLSTLSISRNRFLFSSKRLAISLGIFFSVSFGVSIPLNRNWLFDGLWGFYCRNRFGGGTLGSRRGNSRRSALRLRLRPPRFSQR